MPKSAARSTDSLLRAGGCYITGAALCYSCISAADFCSCSVPLIEKALFTDSGQDTTSGSWGRLAGMNTTKQKETRHRQKKKKKEENHKRLPERPSTDEPQRRPCAISDPAALSEFLVYYVTAVVRDWSVVCILLKTAHSDAKKTNGQSIGLKAEQVENKWKMKAETKTPTLTNVTKKKKKRVKFYSFSFPQNNNTDPPSARMCGISHRSLSLAALKFSGGVSSKGKCMQNICRLRGILSCRTHCTCSHTH